MEYQGMVIRPPSESGSLLLQVTLGCAHNRCTFCGTYRQKPFCIRPMADILREIDESAGLYETAVRRVFLCDGNALVMKTEQLLEILQRIKERFPLCRRVGSYATAADVLRKPAEALAALRALGLGILYLGLESGSDEILRRVNKGSDSQAMVEAVLKCRDAAIAASMMVINGLGGQALWEEHAAETARVLNKMQPDYLAVLALQLIPGTGLWEQARSGAFSPLSPRERTVELHRLIQGLALENCFFSSAHISNLLPQRGVLPGDQARLLAEIEAFIQNTDFSAPKRQYPCW